MSQSIQMDKHTIAVRLFGSPAGHYTPQPLAALRDLMIEEFFNQYKGRIKSARDYQLRDTIIIEAGTLAEGDYPLFDVPAGKNSSTLVGGTEYKKTDADTNLVKSNELLDNESLIITSIQVSAHLTPREFAGFEGGKVADAAPAAAGTMSACNNMVALARGSKFTFEIGREMVSEGRAWDYPPQAHLSGFMGGSDDEGVVQFGSGVPKLLDQILILPGGQFFKVTFFVPEDLALTQYIELEYALCGVLVTASR